MKTPKSGFQTESQQASTSVQSHQASTVSGWGEGFPGCPLPAGWSQDNSRRSPAWQNHHTSFGKTKARQGSRATRSELAPAGESGKGLPVDKGDSGLAACGCGEAVDRPAGVCGAHQGCVLRSLWLVLCWKQQKLGKLSAKVHLSPSHTVGPTVPRGPAWAGAAEADCWQQCLLGSAAGRVPSL